MTGHESRPSPTTVAPLPGFEAEKLLQRFTELDARNQARVLELSLVLIHRQQDEKLPPREREIKRHVDSIDYLLELIQSSGHENVIQSWVWHARLADEQARLAALGVTYFGSGTGPCPDDFSRHLPAP